MTKDIANMYNGVLPRKEACIFSALVEMAKDSPGKNLFCVRRLKRACKELHDLEINDCMAYRVARRLKARQVLLFWACEKPGTYYGVPEHLPSPEEVGEQPLSYAKKMPRLKGDSAIIFDGEEWRSPLALAQKLGVRSEVIYFALRDDEMFLEKPLRWKYLERQRLFAPDLR